MSMSVSEDQRRLHKDCRWRPEIVKRGLWRGALCGHPGVMPGLNQKGICTYFYLQSMGKNWKDRVEPDGVTAWRWSDVHLNHFRPLFKNILLWTRLGGRVRVGEERGVEKWRHLKIIRR